MVKHYIEAVVNYGEFAAFVTATERYQKLAAEHGLEPYTLLASQGTGRMNEVFFEATFDSTQAIADRDAANNAHPDLREALVEVLGYCVPGSIVDRHLQAV
jgi:hypothetical protein